MKYLVRDREEFIRNGSRWHLSGRWGILDVESDKIVESHPTRDSAIERRNELNVQPRQPEPGDKVKVYGHMFAQVPDGFIGIYKGTNAVDNTYYVDTPGFTGAPNSNNYRIFQRVELVEEMTTDTRSELRKWQEDVLVPALLEKEEEHDWCDEFEEFLDDLGLSRPTVDLPTERGSIVELTRGEYASYEAVRVDSDTWFIFDQGCYEANVDDDELQKMGPKV